MEDLWEKVEDVHCEVCGGIYDCAGCGEIVSHFPQYVYRILVQVAKFKIPADQLLKFVEFADERELWLRKGHWTICEACEDLRIDLKDYGIHHHKHGNINTLEVWHDKDDGRIASYNECELVFSATWIGGGQEGKTSELKFVCPTCGGGEIIERMKDKRRIRLFEDGRIEFSDPDGWDRYNCVYFCGDCRSIIRHEKLVYFKDRKHLGRWLSQEPEWELKDSTDLVKETYIDMSALNGSSRKRLRPGELRFVCPNCGANELDECWVSETPIKFYKDGSVKLGFPEYDDNAHRYRCRLCQCVLKDGWTPIDSEYALADYLKDQAVNAA
jgi:hypothetical protein